jgi:hypothetical protein
MKLLEGRKGEGVTWMHLGNRREECEQMKKEVVNALREWRRNKSDRSRFLEAKRRYREACREKKKQRGRGRRKKKEPVSEEITMHEWEEYFMKLLEGRKGEGEAWMRLGNRREKVER